MITVPEGVRISLNNFYQHKEECWSCGAEYAVPGTNINTEAFGRTAEEAIERALAGLTPHLKLLPPILEVPRLTSSDNELPF